MITKNAKQKENQTLKERLCQENMSEPLEYLFSHNEGYASAHALSFGLQSACIISLCKNCIQSSVTLLDATCCICFCVWR